MCTGDNYSLNYSTGKGTIFCLKRYFFVSEKDRPTLRPARSMDSLSQAYPNEGAALVTHFPTDFVRTINRHHK